MCGIFFSIWNSKVDDQLVNSLSIAFDLLKHRGPDNQKLIRGENWSIGHSRLSIMDIKKRSHQPFTDKNERYFLSFNGEIYNFKDIKLSLQNKGYKFETNSDTEVLFKSLLYNGFEKTLKLIRGMFSFIFFDSLTKTLFAARDHLGQKPFHYSFQNNFFCVASEIPSLLKLQSKKVPDFISWRTYLCSNGIIDKDKTFFENIYTLPAGHVLRFHNGDLKIEKYFDILDLHDANYISNNNIKTKKETVETLNFFVKQSIKRHAVSDVPVGVLLSGGIDSSLIFKYVYDDNPAVKTFTKISQDIERIPEQTIPVLLKKFPSSSKYVIQKKQDYLLDSINFIIHTGSPPRWGGGPPMAKVCKQAYTDGVKVLLGGDGVDEMCAGYDSHKDLFDQFKGNLNQIHSILDLDKTCEFYDRVKLEYFLNNRFQEREQALYNLQSIKNAKERFFRATLFQDVGTFLQLCNLPHSDAFSMMESTELRNPFLDLDLIRFVLNEPMKYRFGPHNSGYCSKLIFRELAQEKVGNFINLHKEGTRNYSVYISNPIFWNLTKFKIKEFFHNKKPFNQKVLFKYINLEILYRSTILGELNYLPEILSDIGLKENNI